MKMNLKLTLAVCAIFSGSTLAHAGGEGWSHDFEASKKLAAKEGKVMLVDFTGSDWCGWCIKLNEEVFSHDEFKEGVKDGYVLVELDYPSDKSKLSAETIAQNEKLQEEYSVTGFPTILLMDGEGRPFAKTGYQPGGPVKYVEHLDELSTLKTARDEAFGKAAELEGVEKAKALVAALGSMELDEALVASFYSGQIDAIKAADPSDESGYIKGIEMKAKFADYQAEVNRLGSEGDFPGAMKLTEETIANGGFQGGMAQELVFMKAMIHAQTGEMDKTLEALDASEKIEPGSELGKRISVIRPQIIEKMKEAAADKEPAE